jgi:hypothetical protein
MTTDDLVVAAKAGAMFASGALSFAWIPFLLFWL